VLLGRGRERVGDRDYGAGLCHDPQRDEVVETVITDADDLVRLWLLPFTKHGRAGNTNIAGSSRADDVGLGDETHNPFDSRAVSPAEHIHTVAGGNGARALIEAVVDRDRVGGTGFPGHPVRAVREVGRQRGRGTVGVLVHGQAFGGAGRWRSSVW
jgi:hypothetical protein